MTEGLKSHRLNTDKTQILRLLMRIRVSSVFNPWLNFPFTISR